MSRLVPLVSDSLPPPPQGSVFGQGWTLGSLLAESAGAFVYEVHDDSGRHAALKLFRLPPASHSEAFGRFLREAEAGRSSGHPAAVPVFDGGIGDSGMPFLVMDLIVGRSLAQLFSDPSFRVRQLLQVVDQVLDFAAAMHAAGVLHRDLRPSNIMVEGSGRVRVLDFGIARLPWAPATTPGAVLGTPQFMAPEQARGELIDIRADLYSVAAILYRALSGRYPQQPPAGQTLNATELLWRVGSMPAPALSRVASTVSPKLAAFVMQAMAFEPMLRFRNASAMQDALRKLVSELTPTDLERRLPSAPSADL